MQHNVMCSCSECTASRLGGASSVVPQAEREVAAYAAPPPDDDDDEDVTGDELAVRVDALELAGRRREAELRSAQVRLDAQERRIGELESAMLAMQRAFSPPTAG